MDHIENDRIKNEYLEAAQKELNEYILKNKENNLFKQRRHLFWLTSWLVISALIGVISYKLGIELAYVNDSHIIRLIIFALFATVTALFLANYLGANKNKELDFKNLALELSEKDKKEIILSLENKFSDHISNNIVWTLYNSAENKLRNFSELNVATSTFNDTKKRIIELISDLQIRGNLNLIIGIIITSAGVYSLWHFIIAHDTKDFSDTQLISFFLSRISFVILIEIFAYFFLRLYKNSLEEIKFFHNELTNIDARLTALQISFSQKNKEAVTCIIKELILTEKNARRITENSFNKIDGSITELVKIIVELATRKDSKDS